MSEIIQNMTRDEELVERICRTLSQQQIPKFADGKVPIKVAARVMGKSAIWIQTGMILGWLPIGIAVKDGKPVTSTDDITSDSRIDYTIFPKAFWELTGYVWKGEKK